MRINKWEKFNRSHGSQRTKIALIAAAPWWSPPSSLRP
jgi:hypothetical protein